VIALGAAVVQRQLAPRTPSSGMRRAAGLGVAAASVGLLGATLAQFRRHDTTFEPFEPSEATSLVTEGPNALTRNPMYVGMAGLLVGHAIGRGGWLTPLPVAAFVAVIDRIQVRPEEAALAVNFGEEYADYCRRVPRWVGFRPGSSSPA
jgi:protein-S-isoprenylcysteine O-methyltransferase Ste14